MKFVFLSLKLLLTINLFSLIVSNALFINNDLFVANYKKFLDKFSNEEYLTNIINKYSTKSDSLYTILKYEFLDYEFDINYLIENAKARVKKFESQDGDSRYKCNSY